MSINLLQVVNRENLLDENFVPENLMTIANREGDIVYVPSVVWDSFNAMLRLGTFFGQYLDLTSGYRSYIRQQQLFNESVIENGEKETLKKIAFPGASEHQLGLGIDVSNFTPDGKMREDSKRFDWLHKNCSKFGFIIRYKQEYQDITGVMYEPWHLRYVGEVAQKIESLNLPLEEIVRRQLV